jgi:uncharacterized protein (DUF697 family)
MHLQHHSGSVRRTRAVSKSMRYKPESATMALRTGLGTRSGDLLGLNNWRGLPRDCGWFRRGLVARPATSRLATKGNPDMANDPTDSNVPMTDEEREEAASQLVDRFTLWSGAAGLIPVPIVDLAAIAGVQLQMLRRLSEIYKVPFADNRGKSIIASLAGAIIPASTATTTAMTFGSLIKGIPVIGSTVGALTMPLYSACATFVIGKVFQKHFASGGTLLDFNPPDYREFIKAQQEKFRRKSTSSAGQGTTGA